MSVPGSTYTSFNPYEVARIPFPGYDNTNVFFQEIKPVIVVPPRDEATDSSEEDGFTTPKKRTNGDALKDSVYETPIPSTCTFPKGSVRNLTNHFENPSRSNSPYQPPKESSKASSEKTADPFGFPEPPKTDPMDTLRRNQPHSSSRTPLESIFSKNSDSERTEQAKESKNFQKVSHQTSGVSGKYQGNRLETSVVEKEGNENEKRSVARKLSFNGFTSPTEKELTFLQKLSVFVFKKFGKRPYFKEGRLYVGIRAKVGRLYEKLAKLSPEDPRIPILEKTLANDLNQQLIDWLEKIDSSLVWAEDEWKIKVGLGLHFYKKSILKYNEKSDLPEGLQALLASFNQNHSEQQSDPVDILKKIKEVPFLF